MAAGLTVFIAFEAFENAKPALFPIHFTLQHPLGGQERKTGTAAGLYAAEMTF